MKFLVINGVNLNMLGVREPEIYGSKTLADLEVQLTEKAESEDFEIDFFQSNYEGAIVEEIQKTMGVYDGIIINPGAFTHYSYAIHDAISSVNVPCVEVHISDIQNREDFRKKSVIVPACIGQVAGFGFCSYEKGIDILLNKLKGEINEKN